MAATDVERLFGASKFENVPRTRGEAVALGVKRYFTGVPCLRGHFSYRKACNTACIECHKENTRAFEALHIEEKRERGREYAARNREKNTRRSAEWAKSNKGKIIDYQSRFRKTEKRRAYVTEWLKNNKEKTASYRANRRSRELSAEGVHNGANIIEIRKHQCDRCACCSANVKGSGHIDHIISLARGGSNWPRNLQILCGPCNQSKSDRDPIEFMQSRGKLI